MGACHQKVLQVDQFVSEAQVVPCIRPSGVHDRKHIQCRAARVVVRLDGLAALLRGAGLDWLADGASLDPLTLRPSASFSQPDLNGDLSPHHSRQPASWATESSNSCCYVHSLLLPSSSPCHSSALPSLVSNSCASPLRRCSSSATTADAHLLIRRCRASFSGCPPLWCSHFALHRT
eukprot:2876896-Prymnesium_polylepis.1